jgi:3-oxoacyl-[acyl-carrier-protein] synthase II
LFIPSGRPPVITGVGVVSSNGMGCGEFVEGLRAGRSGIRGVPFDGSMLKVHFAASVAGFEATKFLSVQDVRRTPRAVHLAAAASAEALEMAGMVGEDRSQEPEARMNEAEEVRSDRERARGTGLRTAQTRGTLRGVEAEEIGVMLGSGGGGLAFVEEQYRMYFTGQRGYSPFTITAGTHGNLSSELSIHFGLRGPSHCISTGCTSSTDAIGTAAMHIRMGTCPAFLVGGADAPIAEGIMRGFEVMRILAGDREPARLMSRPFSKDRDGFVLGEGAWMFVLEDAEFAERRGARVLAEVIGYASTCDAYHRVQPKPDATDAARAIGLAMQQAGVSAADLDYVNLHGTSTQMNDALETLAVKKALGEAAARRVPMSSTKSMIGHPQGACGAAGVAAAILSLRAGFVHPTVNLVERDEACDLDYVAEGAREIAAKDGRGMVAMCNCIAFGSKNSAVVVRVKQSF